MNRSLVNIALVFSYVPFPVVIEDMMLCSLGFSGPCSGLAPLATQLSEPQV